MIILGLLNYFQFQFQYLIYYHTTPRGNFVYKLGTILSSNEVVLLAWPRDGTTCISCKFGDQMAPLALVANLTTRWCHLHYLQIWPPDGATCITCKFDHQMVPLALVANLTTRWGHLYKLHIIYLATKWHNLNCLQSWPPDGATCISCKFGHQMAPLALVANLATRWRH